MYASIVTKSIALENATWFEDNEEKTDTNTTTSKLILIDNKGDNNVNFSPTTFQIFQNRYSSELSKNFFDNYDGYC